MDDFMTPFSLLARREAALIALLNNGYSFDLNPNLRQPRWFIDPQNKSGNARDTNVGVVSSEPVRTWNGGVIARYGTKSPILPIDVDWTYLSDSPSDGSDPVVFSPTMIGGLGRFSSIPTLVGSGTFLALTPRNRAAGNLLSADLGGIVGLAPGMWVVNTTPGKNSYANLIRNTGGNVWDLSQPIEPGVGVVTNSINEVNTWANGDTFNVMRNAKVDFTVLNPDVSQLSLGALNFFTLFNIDGLDTSPTFSSGPAGLYVGDRIYVNQCAFAKRIVLTRPTDGGNNLFINCALMTPNGPSAIVGGSNIAQASGSGSKPWFYAGWANGIALEGAYIDADAVVLGNGRINGGLIGTVYVDGGVRFRVAGGVELTDAGTFGAAIYGPGSLNAEFGRLHITGSTATASLLYLGSTQINGDATAYSSTNTNPSVINGLVPLTPANIDAPAGPAGFGGNAFNPGGGCISTT
jgi:hypothetical protein